MEFSEVRLAELFQLGEQDELVTLGKVLVDPKSQWWSGIVESEEDERNPYLRRCGGGGGTQRSRRRDRARPKRAFRSRHRSQRSGGRWREVWGADLARFRPRPRLGDTHSGLRLAVFQEPATRGARSGVGKPRRPSSPPLRRRHGHPPGILRGGDGRRIGRRR